MLQGEIITDYLKNHVQYSNTLGERNLRNTLLLNSQSDVREINHCTLKS